MQIGVFLVFALGLGILLLGLGYFLGRATAPQRPAPASTEPTATQEESPTEGEASVSPQIPGLHVRTNPQKGHRLVVHVDGFAYLRYDAMSDDHRRRLRTYLLQIRDWMETTQGDIPLTPPRRKRTPVPSSQEPPIQETDLQAKDMVSAINTILQAKLKASGTSTAVTVMRDWRGTGVVIMVDGVRYDAVADIPDEQVRRLMQEAVQEWEALQRRKSSSP